MSSALLISTSYAMGLCAISYKPADRKLGRTIVLAQKQSIPNLS